MLLCIGWSRCLKVNFILLRELSQTILFVGDLLNRFQVDTVTLDVKVIDSMSMCCVSAASVLMTALTIGCVRCSYRLPSPTSCQRGLPLLLGSCRDHFFLLLPHSRPPFEDQRTTLFIGEQGCFPDNYVLDRTIRWHLYNSGIRGSGTPEQGVS